MRTALCFSGEIRGFHHCFPNMQFLLNHFRNAGELDVYFYGSHLKAGEVPIESLIPEAQCVYVQDDPKWGQHVNSEYLPDASAWPHYKYPPNVIGGIVTWKTKQAYTMARNSGKHYDMVIRSRTDNFYVTPFNVAAINPNRLTLSRRFAFGGYCERIAFGNMEIMEVFCNFYEHINDFRGNFECRIQDYIHASKMPVELIEIDFYQKQADGSDRYKGTEHYGLDVPASVVRPARFFTGNGGSVPPHALT